MKRIHISPIRRLHLSSFLCYRSSCVQLHRTLQMPKLEDEISCIFVLITTCLLRNADCVTAETGLLNFPAMSATQSMVETPKHLAARLGISCSSALDFPIMRQSNTKSCCNRERIIYGKGKQWNRADPGRGEGGRLVEDVACSERRVGGSPSAGRCVRDACVSTPL